VEKMAKAVLIASSVPPPRIHDIEKLAGLVAARNAEIGRTIAEFAELTTWYVSARYPDESFDSAPSADDISSAVTKLQVLRQRIDSLAPKA
jgi:HEPN domain-containing protein